MIARVPGARNLATALLFFLAAVSVVSAQDLLSPAGRSDRPQGAEDAPVTLIEYSSPTCGHCVVYRNDVAPRVHTEYVKTGKVRLIYRPFVRNAIDAAIFMLAESRTGDEYNVVLDAYYKRYNEIAGASNVRALLEEIAETVGIDGAEFERVLSDRNGLEPIEQLTRQAVDQFGVKGTPTFFINSKMHVGELTFERISAAIDTELMQ